jgi:tetrahydromethanopterin S-methyltransferase subunit H
MDIDNDALATVDRLERIQSLQTVDDYKHAGMWWRAGREMMDAIKAGYDPLIADAHTAHKNAIAMRDKFLAPVEAATKRVKSLMAAWDAAQERARKAEQARLEAEARQVEQDRKLAEAVIVATTDPTAADAILEEPIMVAPVIIPKAVPKVEGIVYREVWKFRIINPDLIPREYMVPDEKAIGGIVRALKGQTRIPGIEAYSERV